MTVALMYHALHHAGNLSAIDEEDRPYAVSMDAFRRQLDMLQSNGQASVPMAGMSDPDYIITFDDGHLSNAELALPELAQRGLSAMFFITTGYTGKRAHFCGVDELVALSQAGMTLGTHGVTHRFFDDLDRSDAQLELEDSRAMLEDMVNCKCQSLSFPGGRYASETLHLLEPAGYRQWYGSAVGLITPSHWATTSVGDNKSMPDGKQSEHVCGSDSLELREQLTMPLPRVAIRAGTSDAEFKSMIAPELQWYRRQRSLAAAKTGLRRLLGNRFYHSLYKLRAR